MGWLGVCVWTRLLFIYTWYACLASNSVDIGSAQTICQWRIPCQNVVHLFVLCLVWRVLGIPFRLEWTNVFCSYVGLGTHVHTPTCLGSLLTVVIEVVDVPLVVVTGTTGAWACSLRNHSRPQQGGSWMFVLTFRPSLFDGILAGLVCKSSTILICPTTLLLQWLLAWARSIGCRGFDVSGLFPAGTFVWVLVFVKQWESLWSDSCGCANEM